MSRNVVVWSEKGEKSPSIELHKHITVWEVHSTDASAQLQYRQRINKTPTDNYFLLTARFETNGNYFYNFIKFPFFEIYKF